MFSYVQVAVGKVKDGQFCKSESAAKMLTSTGLNAARYGAICAAAASRLIDLHGGEQFTASNYYGGLFFCGTSHTWHAFEFSNKIYKLPT